jgi:hypothetical protein
MIEYRDTDGVIFKNRDFDDVLWYQVRAFVGNLSDSIGLADTIGEKNILKALSDSIALADIITKNSSKPLSDSIGVSDSPVKNVQINKSDSIGLADIITKNSSKPLSDSIGLADSPVKNTSKPLSDFIGLADIIAKTSSISLADIVAFADAITGKNIQINKNDSVNFSDVIAFNMVKALQEVLAIGDSIAKTTSIIQSDIIALADSITGKNISKSLSDSISIGDVLEDGIEIKFKDTDVIFENRGVDGVLWHKRVTSIVKNIQIVKQETLLIEDFLAKNTSYHLQDQFVIGDTLFKNYIKDLIDSFGLADDFSATLINDLPDIFRDMVVVPARVRSVSAPARKRQVICTPIHLQGGNMDCSLETDLLEFSPKQNWEEYYAVFNFARVITPLTTIAHATILVYDEAGVEVSETFTDDTKTQIVGSKVYVWVRGGTEQTYKITCRIIMSNGEKFEQDATLEVVEV